MKIFLRNFLAKKKIESPEMRTTQKQSITLKMSEYACKCRRSANNILSWLYCYTFICTCAFVEHTTQLAQIVNKCNNEIHLKFTIVLFFLRLLGSKNVVK